MILFGLRDIGSMNACLPVLDKLSDRRLPWYIYAEGPALDRLKKYSTFVIGDSIDYVLDSINPSLVVVTCATVGGGIPIDLTIKAKKRNLPVVLIEETWTAHSAFIWDVLPDGVFVVDELAKSMILRSWPNFPESEIQITGSPVFDKFADVDIVSAKNRLRKKLELYQDWPVIFFPGTGLTSGMPGVLNMLVKALNNYNSPAYLILRDHPSVENSKALEYRAWLKNLEVVKVIDSSLLSSDDVNMGSDIVVGTFSTMTIEACYLRKPVLTIWSPEIEQVFSGATHNNLTKWPIVDLGASYEAKNIKEIEYYLERMFHGDTADIKESQERHFRTDGLSGERIATAMLRYQI